MMEASYESIRTVSAGGYCSTDHHIFPLLTKPDREVIILHSKNYTSAFSPEDSHAEQENLSQ